ncbi:MAG: Gfo/Idh/MocA family protein [Rubripirellula sp.]
MPNKPTFEPIPRPLRPRREFLKAATAVTVATIVPRHVLGGPNHVAPSDRVNVALVGAGGRGLQNAKELLKLDDVRVTVVADPAAHWDLKDYYYRGVAGREPTCDVIEKHSRKSDPKFKVRQVTDYRKLLADDAADIDAVLCATPDHLHAHVSLAAMRAGKHVYCEKPLTHNIAEARLVSSVARETGVATQLGNQGHSTDTMRLTVELVKAGAIGTVREVHAWVPATRWNPTLKSPPTDAQPIPAGLNWDLWCGPREPVGFHAAYAPVSWRDFWQFGCGAMGDFGCHDLDAAVWALDLEMPERVEMRAAGSTDPGMSPFGEVGYFDFAARGEQPPVRITWYSGGLRPPTPDQLNEGNSGKPQRLPARGTMFIGDKGVMVCGGAGGRPDLYPQGLRDSVPTPDETIARSNGHHRDWIDAIKGGPAASSEFQYGAKLTEITLLGLLALQTGKIIHWDAETMKATGAGEADKIIHGTYRDGWKLT